MKAFVKRALAGALICLMAVASLAAMIPAQAQAVGSPVAIPTITINGISGPDGGAITYTPTSADSAQLQLAAQLGKEVGSSVLGAVNISPSSPFSGGLATITFDCPTPGTLYRYVGTSEPEGPWQPLYTVIKDGKATAYTTGFSLFVLINGQQKVYPLATVIIDMSTGLVVPGAISSVSSSSNASLYTGFASQVIGNNPVVQNPSQFIPQAIYSINQSALSSGGKYMVSIHQNYITSAATFITTNQSPQNWKLLDSECREYPANATIACKTITAFITADTTNIALLPVLSGQSGIVTPSAVTYYNINWASPSNPQPTGNAMTLPSGSQIQTGKIYANGNTTFTYNGQEYLILWQQDSGSTPGPTNIYLENYIPSGSTISVVNVGGQRIITGICGQFLPTNAGAKQYPGVTPTTLPGMFTLTGYTYNVLNGSTPVPVANLIATSNTATVLSSGTAVSPTYVFALKGDIDQNGLMNVSDYIKLKQSQLQYLTLTSLQNISADVSGDGAVNLTDVIMLKQTLLGNTTIKYQ